MSTEADLAAVEAAVRDDVVHGSVELDVITVSGADAVDYLQGQLSQDVATLAVGATRWSLLLQPQGKVEAWIRLFRVDPERLWLLVEAGHGEAALARLERFKLRVDVSMDLELITAIALRGPASHRGAEQLAASIGYLQIDAGWGPIAGVDLIPDGSGGARPDPVSIDLPGVAADAGAMELIRILQGRPMMGRELDSSTIPAAAGVVDESVDFTKGCYVGQELVARIDSRGSKTPTRLVRVVGPATDAVEAGSTLIVEGVDGGTLTSVTPSPEHGIVGLAYVKRVVEVPGTAELSADGSAIEVQLLPLGPGSRSGTA